MPDWITQASQWNAQYGWALMRALWFLIAAVVVVRAAHWLMKRYLPERITKARAFGLAMNVIYLLVLLQAVIMAMHQLGFDLQFLGRVAMGAILAAVALAIILRPLFPSLPFKVGNTIQAAGLLGKVEAISALNTRLRTFDGKTLFVPNTKILGDTIVNYHFTPNRRVGVDVYINYEDDLARAKEIMLAEMKADERTLEKPLPRVYVLSQDDGCVKLGARCWVPNLKYFKARSDLTERFKLRFDQEENISLAYPQRGVRILREPDGGRRTGADLGPEGGEHF